METKRRSRGVSAGIVTIIVMLSVIAMTIFAALSLSTARQEKRLADRYAQSVADYWAADAACSDLADRLHALWASGADEEALSAAARDLGADAAWEGTALTVAYSRPIDETRQLRVSLRLDDDFTILAWQTAERSEDSWSPDDSLPVYQGDEIIIIE